MPAWTSKRSRRAPTPWPGTSGRCWSTPSWGSSARNTWPTGKQIIRAGLEDHFCGKLLGLPMGCDVCHTNHAEADADDMDALLAMLAAAGVTFVMGVPGADDIMLGYQSTSFHDALAMRELIGRRPAPEFEAWLQQPGPAGRAGRVRPAGPARPDAGVAAVTAPTDDPWRRLRRLTAARIGLPRSGRLAGHRPAAGPAPGPGPRARRRARRAGHGGAGGRGRAAAGA